MPLIISQGCGKDLTMIEKDTSRVRYLSPEEGVDYGLIDKVLYPQELRVQVTDSACTIFFADVALHPTTPTSLISPKIYTF